LTEETRRCEAPQLDGPTPLDDPSLKVPRPAVRGLAAAGITTLAAAQAADDRALLACHGVGQKAVRIIRALDGA
jgi:hypothetical protein